MFCHRLQRPQAFHNQRPQASTISGHRTLQRQARAGVIAFMQLQAFHIHAAAGHFRHRLSMRPHAMQKVLEFQITALYDGLDKVPGTAIAWSLKQDQQKLLPREGQGLPQKFFVKTWFPQAEALNLPEVAVVITHCGWGGLNEAILAGKPIVATPFRADQPTSARRN